MANRCSPPFDEEEEWGRHVPCKSTCPNHCHRHQCDHHAHAHSHAHSSHPHHHGCHHSHHPPYHPPHLYHHQFNDDDHFQQQQYQQQERLVSTIMLPYEVQMQKYANKKAKLIKCWGRVMRAFLVHPVCLRIPPPPPLFPPPLCISPLAMVSLPYIFYFCLSIWNLAANSIRPSIRPSAKYYGIY